LLFANCFVYFVYYLFIFRFCLFLVSVYSAETNQLVKEIKHGKVNIFVATETYVWSGDDSGVICVWNPQVRITNKHTTNIK
jgi:hypothetical protein